MARALFAAAVVAASARAAMAAPVREVRIETEPEGAKIYFNSKEDGEKCTTPCTVKAPVGETPIIIEAEKYRPAAEILEVPARGGKLKFSFKLQLALGDLVVSGPRGATILVDGEEKGTAPATVSVEAAPHTIEVQVGGKRVFMDSVEVEAGQEMQIAPKAPVETASTETSLSLEDDEGPKVTRPAGPSEPRTSPYVALAAEMDVSYRSFTYDNGGANLSEYTEGGHVVVGPAIEIYVGALSGVHALRGLAITGRADFNVNSRVVQRPDGSNTSATSSAQIFEGSIRQRWTIGDSASVEVGAGYVRDRFTFSGMTSDVLMVPAADYSSIRLGARGALSSGSLEGYLQLENRIVLSGGPLGDRFYQSDASGLHAALGATKHWGALSARLEGAVTRYAWTFKANSPSDPFIADGATDLIARLLISVGYSY